MPINCLTGKWTLPVIARGPNKRRGLDEKGMPREEDRAGDVCRRPAMIARIETLVTIEARRK
jgi:hypothetical protein